MHEVKRVLVTGGAGFIGSFLCERLIEQGCEVICVDNFFTGSRRNISAPLGRLPVRVDAPRRDVPAILGSRPNLQHGLPGLACALST